MKDQRWPTAFVLGASFLTSWIIQRLALEAQAGAEGSTRARGEHDEHEASAKSA